jgi:hypothetical protein
LENAAIRENIFIFRENGVEIDNDFIFRTCYAANPRPDALMKEQLVEMTGLSPRVIRVWFQNKRCKDKKKTIQLKMQMQQEKVNIFLVILKFLLFIHANLLMMFLKLLFHSLMYFYT